MYFTDIYHGAEKAIAFTIMGMLINSRFSLKIPVLGTATLIAGANCFLDYKSDNYESIAALSFLTPIYLIHNRFFGESGSSFNDHD